MAGATSEKRFEKQEFWVCQHEKIRAKQQSRLTMIKAENANSKLLRINGRKRKNFIQKLDTDRGVVLDHKGKKEHIYDHFTKLFGTPAQRRFTLDWGGNRSAGTGLDQPGGTVH